MPTMVWCFKPLMRYEYDKDFFFLYRPNIDSDSRRVYLEQPKFYWPEYQETVEFTRLSEHCYSIAATTARKVKIGEYRAMEIRFNTKLEEYELPREHEVWITSRDNGWGRVHR